MFDWFREVPVNLSRYAMNTVKALGYFLSLVSLCVGAGRIKQRQK